MNVIKEAVITAAFVNQPKPDRKNGTIKGKDDVLWLAKPPILAQFQPGGQYKIKYEEYTIGGNNFKEIKAAEQVGSAPASKAQDRVFVAPQDPHLAERIFVCGAINATLSNPNVQPYELAGSALIELVSKYRKVWQATFGGSPVKAADDMGGDGISY